jgi:hypothetical protein
MIYLNSGAPAAPSTYPEPGGLPLLHKEGRAATGLPCKARQHGHPGWGGGIWWYTTQNNFSLGNIPTLASSLKGKSIRVGNIPQLLRKRTQRVAYRQHCSVCRGLTVDLIEIKNIVL